MLKVSLKASPKVTTKFNFRITTLRNGEKIEFHRNLDIDDCRRSRIRSQNPRYLSRARNHSIVKLLKLLPDAYDFGK
jgi:hypothetical protein